MRETAISSSVGASFVHILTFIVFQTRQAIIRLWASSVSIIPYWTQKVPIFSYTCIVRIICIYLLWSSFAPCLVTFNCLQYNCLLGQSPILRQFSKILSNNLILLFTKLKKILLLIVNNLRNIIYQFYQYIHNRLIDNIAQCVFLFQCFTQCLLMHHTVRFLHNLYFIYCSKCCTGM